VLPTLQQIKLVTFCPESAVDDVRNALASIGAGQIGGYSQCSFAMRGHGTFFGSSDTKPAKGEAGRLERLEETRLEMVCSRASLPLATTVLRQAHPYEEPPIEVYELAGHPLRGVGAGRRITFDQPITLAELVARLKQRLGVGQVFVAEGGRGSFSRVGMCVGAGGSMLDDAITQDCHAFITGEMRHHAVLDAIARGCTVLLAGHTNTERGYLPVLRDRLAEELPQATLSIATRDRDPLRMM
jgi:hypothetical protein